MREKGIIKSEKSLLNTSTLVYYLSSSGSSSFYIVAKENETLIYVYTLESSAKMTNLELGEMPLLMSIFIIKNRNGPRTGLLGQSTQSRISLVDI